MSQQNEDYLKSDKKFFNYFNQNKIESIELIIPVKTLTEHSFDVYSSHTLVKINNFFEKLLDTKISVFKEIGKKHYYQKVQPCYSVSSIVDFNKIQGYNFQLNPLFCYNLFFQKFFSHPFLRLQFKTFLEQKYYLEQISSKTFVVFLLIVIKLSLEKNYYIRNKDLVSFF